MCTDPPTLPRTESYLVFLRATFGDRRGLTHTHPPHYMLVHERSQCYYSRQRIVCDPSLRYFPSRSEQLTFRSLVNCCVGLENSQPWPWPLQHPRSAVSYAKKRKRLRSSRTYDAGKSRISQNESMRYEDTLIRGVVEP